MVLWRQNWVRNDHSHYSRVFGNMCIFIYREMIASVGYRDCGMKVARSLYLTLSSISESMKIHIFVGLMYGRHESHANDQNIYLSCKSVILRIPMLLSYQFWSKAREGNTDFFGNFFLDNVILKAYEDLSEDCINWMILRWWSAALSARFGCVISNLVERDAGQTCNSSTLIRSHDGCSKCLQNQSLWVMVLYIMIKSSAE